MKNCFRMGKMVLNIVIWGCRLLAFMAVNSAVLHKLYGYTSMIVFPPFSQRETTFRTLWTLLSNPAFS